MAKKKPEPEKPAKKEPVKNRSKIIKALIIGGTFAAIAILSIITQGPGGARPAPGVIAMRILLLSVCSALYFWMLYYTQSSRQNDKGKPGK